MNSFHSLLHREESLLVLVDLQEKLLPVIHDRAAVTANALKLLQFAKIIGLPVMVTEQDKLGPTVASLAAELGGVTPVAKVAFDCFGEPAFAARLAELGRCNLILAGIEAHICVAQTALTGLARYNVHVVTDAIGSRAPANRQVALDRLAQAGAVLSSTEMVIYELLRRAGTDEFRATLKLVK